MPHKQMKRNFVIRTLATFACIVLALLCITGCTNTPVDTPDKNPEGTEAPNPTPNEPATLAGLYDKTSGKLLYTWEKLVENKIIAVKSNAWTQTSSSIEGHIVMPDNISSIGAKAAYNCAGLTGITTSKSVTLIGAQAFQGCTGITSVKIEESVTRISDNAFRSCTGLKYLEIGEGVTDIGNYAFEGCTALPYLIISNSVTNIGKYAFANCTGLLDVLIGNGVTNIGNSAFELCTGMTRITFGKKVTNIGTKAIYDCGALKEIGFCGSKEAWESVTVGKNNPAILEGLSTMKFAVSSVRVKNEINSAIEGNSDETPKTEETTQDPVQSSAPLPDDVVNP